MTTSLTQRGIERAASWYYATLLINHKGEILALSITLGNTNDRTPIYVKVLQVSYMQIKDT